MADHGAKPERDANREHGAKPDPGLPWWPAPRGRAREREPLSLDEIVAAAIRLIDAEGLDALSMRRLGQELGAGATSLYWHVRSKEQLLDLVTDAILGEVPFDDDPGLAWRERAARTARGVREALRHHPNAATLPAFRVTLGPNALQGTESMLGVLRSAGFEGAELWHAYQSILTFTLGWAILESRPASGSIADEAGGDPSQAAVALLSSLPADRYPNLRAMATNAEALAATADGDSFEYGLQRLLDGIEVALAKRSGGRQAQ